MKKWLKIAALVTALAIIAGLCVFANALVGNPVSKWLATRTAEKHLEKVYGDTDFVIEKFGFNFKPSTISSWFFTVYKRASITVLPVLYIFSFETFDFTKFSQDLSVGAK